ncbi:MAG TPA: hypothetical protein H9717_06845 [Candidatus Eisenbergiella merdipullorum]|uniref:Uncharacterized protein n=1 Tax=Candidatus Eisenbergiella merdipullorum TaxID=2838553 RepID=A0A9D2L0W4_9FIRM|nr:hypothetical protein [Candidatus Eisenbergiella merdipullorum]
MLTLFQKIIFEIRDILFGNKENQCANIVDKYLKIILFFCPIMSIIDSWMNGKSSIFIFPLLTVLTALTVLMLIGKGMGKIQVKFSPAEILLLLIALGLIVKIFVHRKVEMIDIQLLFFVGEYFLARNWGTCNRKYLYLVLISSLSLIAGYCYVIANSMQIFSYYEIYSLLLMYIFISASLYCTQKKHLCLTYVFFFFFWFFLGLWGNQLVLMLAFLELMFLPNLFYFTASFLKKYIVLFFTAMFALDIVAVLSYLDFLNSYLEINYQLYIFISFIYTIGAFFVIRYWEKISSFIDTEKVILVKVKRNFNYILFLIGFVIIFLLVQDSLSFKNTELEFLENIYINCKMSVLQEKNIPTELAQNYGFLGLMIGAFFLGLLFLRMWKKMKKIKRIENKIIIYVALLFVIQSFFYGISLVNLPVYIFFVSTGVGISESPKLVDGSREDK